jgi:hypothetical protein
MASTYNLIKSVTVESGGAANITFTSIPQTYTDLCLFLSGRVDIPGPNGPTDPNYNSYLLTNAFPLGGGARTRYLLYDGSTSSSASDTNNILLLGITSSAATANTFGNTFAYFTNYASTTLNKSVSIDQVSENNATASTTMLSAGLYPANDAITSITIETFSTGNFVQHSTAYLYGVSNT